MVVESGLNAMKKDARGLSRVVAGNPGFPQLVPVTSGRFSRIGKDPDATRDWGQEEKGMTEDEMAGWHH